MKKHRGKAPARIKALVVIGCAGLLCSCGKSTTWLERTVPTTDAERAMIKSHVEAIIPGWPDHVSGDDQDLEDMIEAAHQEARASFCRRTLWEYDDSFADLKPTGRWRYVEEAK
jgi:hypothetical protein